MIDSDCQPRGDPWLLILAEFREGRVSTVHDALAQSSRGMVPAPADESLCRWFACGGSWLVCNGKHPRRCRNVLILSVALQRFAGATATTYALVLRVVPVAPNARTEQATRERNEHFFACSRDQVDAGCHANVAKYALRDDCCTGVIACRKLKCASAKGGIGVKRGVFF
jgi:hypothetical protein